MKLPNSDLRKNTELLFQQLESDDEARKAFIVNPTGILSTTLLKRALPEQEISDANRVLFAMLANDGFRDWLDNY